MELIQDVFILILNLTFCPCFAAVKIKMNW